MKTHGGKGSAPRPFSVDQATFGRNHDAIFKKKDSSWKKVYIERRSMAKIANVKTPIDLTSVETITAIENFVKRVQTSSVYGEAGSPLCNHETLLAMGAVLNDALDMSRVFQVDESNVCLKITNAVFDKETGFLELTYEPYGPKADIFEVTVASDDSAEQQQYGLCGRFVLKSYPYEAIIFQIVTFDFGQVAL